MPKHSKRYNEIVKKVEREKFYSLEEAVKLIKEIANAKFNETIELSLKTGIDPKKNEQQVRSTISLPHGTGKNVRVLVFAVGPNAQAAKEAGADYVGGEELAQKILSEGFTDFDVAIASPDTMGFVGKLGKVLGPRGLMPSPKSGTVTSNVAEAVKSFKAGRVEVRNDKTGNLHLPVGKRDFDAEKLAENIKSAVQQINSLRPQGVKGRFLQKIVVSPTMGPGVKLDLSQFEI
ncbi:MAG: 50S ribosomal protein L1 [Mesoaciditoga sp.]|uniref:50S ribosomal protein L1 n=1 Tax=Athalassotoga sp. TaxID=2022597 RepID=UPI000CBA34FD|nr:MAG: 50S ribosomal protein L1 [Mesoaciditoga sp.]PMP80057.1 MAG: 50S ribosomal protein L1 [Mesoaciditoga sp.]HEU24019.1 50S ribosomal protein L1 [Mesoaciditoga lauensis]